VSRTTDRTPRRPASGHFAGPRIRNRSAHYNLLRLIAFQDFRPAGSATSDARNRLDDVRDLLADLPCRHIVLDRGVDRGKRALNDGFLDRLPTARSTPATWATRSAPLAPAFTTRVMGTCHRRCPSDGLLIRSGIQGTIVRASDPPRSGAHYPSVSVSVTHRDGLDRSRSRRATVSYRTAGVSQSTHELPVPTTHVVLRCWCEHR
jgi:hypothetical protein